MSVYGIEVPERNTIDTLAEQREQRDQRTRARMSATAYHAEILERLGDMLVDPREPLGELVAMLFDAPLRDSYDYKAFLAMRDPRRLGAAVLRLICDVSLEAYQEADTDGF